MLPANVSAPSSADGFASRTPGADLLARYLQHLVATDRLSDP
jgi:hypothetical protein